MLVKWFRPSALLGQAEFEKLALNYVVLGNAYLQKLKNRFGRVTKLINQPALPMRRHKKPDKYVNLKDDGGRIEFQTGAHMGYILVTNDADLNDDTAKEIEKQVKNSKGPGNFRSLYLNIGRSNSKEPVKVIPVGDIGTKDEFDRIKNVTEREMLAMHRMQPGLSGIIPQNTSGFGDMEKIMRVYHELEITALQKPFMQLNEVVGEEVVRFEEPVWW